MPTIALLIASNCFMTIAWYWHLKGGEDKALPLVIVISWAIAFFEYCLAVPANRIGYLHGWTGGQLKVTQEVITLAVFTIFAIVVLKEPLTWRHAGAFGCLVGAAAFMFAGR
ncbi:MULTISPECIES: DMT family protein [Sphingomonas]|uniref:DMT family protein n=1 Tax=Sphingomonas adhaesiva TaxID=28212 RepID=A0A2A4I8Q9_9SPHN|nr:MULTISPECIES: DMT family protein [Sphingomonas]PCG14172.1 hypothetical protein COA07_10215 [Sphingomonas adhaesiva]PZU81151.1 MAG: hypothetical protein DI530_03375 [Sphingomonas sp.]